MRELLGNVALYCVIAICRGAAKDEVQSALLIEMLRSWQLKYGSLLLIEHYNK